MMPTENINVLKKTISPPVYSDVLVFPKYSPRRIKLNRPSSLQNIGLFLKRMLDIVVASIFLVLSAPFFLAISLAIAWESPGFPLYSQKRRGYKNREFNIFKFRSMVQGAHKKREMLLGKNEVDGILFKMEKDPRVTRLGSILRKLSIDEVPQLINVLRGEMSLIGPRPFTIEIYDRAPDKNTLYNDWVQMRHEMKPGLSGLWQVSGRHRLPFEDLMLLDLYYVNNWSPWLDIKIFFKTFPAIFTDMGA